MNNDIGVKSKIVMFMADTTSSEKKIYRSKELYLKELSHVYQNYYLQRITGFQIYIADSLLLKIGDC